jgi:DNA-binding transcriptional regulator PaaX
MYSEHLEAKDPFCLLSFLKLVVFCQHLGTKRQLLQSHQRAALTRMAKQGSYTAHTYIYMQLPSDQLGNGATTSCP